MRLSRIVLQCRDPGKLAAFYRDALQMTARPGPDGSFVAGYGGSYADLELRPAPTGGVYAHHKSDRYWKIGITVPDLELAVSTLRFEGADVGAPHQFEDIGYMAHLDDPEGFKIELLQQNFQARPKKLSYLLSSEVFCGIGQVTLRVSDLDRALAFYRDRLGMRVLSIQPVAVHGFTLYFLAFTDEAPPNPDLRAVENREWLWHRPYTTLELQVFDERNAFQLPADGAPGFAGIVIDGSETSGKTLTDDCGGLIRLANTHEF